MSKQTVVNMIFEQLNLLSNRDFQIWMLNNYDRLYAIKKDQIVNAVDGFPIEARNLDGEQYYNQIYIE